MVNILMSRSGALNSSWAKPIVSKILKKEMKIAVLGFSFFNNLTKEEYSAMYNDNSEYNLKIDELFLEFGITNVEWIYYYGMKKEEMVNIINKADVLYFPGGSPDLMISRIVEKDILNELKSFNKIVIGSSAGAMIQLGHFHISPDNEYHKFSEHTGLGYLNEFFIEVHYNRRKKQKQGMRKIRKNYKKPVYIIPDEGMLIVDSNKITCLNDARLYFDHKKKIK